MDHHLQLTLTYQRHTLLQRALWAYLNQDYEGKSTLLIFNTGEKFELGNFDIPQNKSVILINSQKDYPSVGDKYLASMEYWPESATTINIVDDDDYQLFHGMRVGLKGLKDSEKQGWKSEKSWFHYQGNLTLEGNNLEGSIYMDIEHVKKHKFGSGLSVKYHDNWLLPLDLKIDKEAKPYLLYDWSTPVPCYKMSGRLESQENYQISKVEARDIGNGILIPSSKHIINDKRLY